ncbi:MAG: hypothetical protein NUV67_06080 [archaeon]|nr:hypothetical protein [archaeon]
MREKILVVAKTYPNLSKKYVETVCIAGINDRGEWRRIYPIPFRKLPFEKRFTKYDWIEADIEKNIQEKLKRLESYKVDANTIRVIKKIGTGKNRDWQERNSVILPLKNSSLEELKKLKSEKKSLGLIKPIVVDFIRTPLEKCRDWERELIEGSQRTLFETGYQSPLEKIPWKFSYIFKCNNSQCKGHNIMCEDWELLQSWRSWRKNYPSDSELWEKIRERYFELMKKRDLHFFMGTESRYNKFLIIGLYYPPQKNAEE